MKRVVNYIRMIVLLLFLVSCNDFPYGLKYWDMDAGSAMITDENGYPVLQEGKILIENNSRIKEFTRWTKNRLGFVLVFTTTDNKLYYFSVKPAKEQFYAELAVETKLYTPYEYELLNINDDWEYVFW